MNRTVHSEIGFAPCIHVRAIQCYRTKLMHAKKNLKSYLAGTCLCICPAFPEHDLLDTARGTECETGGIAGQEDGRLLSYVVCWLIRK